MVGSKRIAAAGARGRGRRWPGLLPLVGLLLAFALAVATPVVAATKTVTMKGVQFNPSPLTVHVGDTVRWVNDDFIAHTVTPVSGGFTGSGVLQPGKSYSAKMTKVGTFNYYDSLNPIMKGTLIVTAAPATPKPTPKPTAKPTPKPTPKPTAKPTATATAVAAASASASVAESPSASGGAAGGSVTPGGSPGAASASGSAAPGEGGTPAASSGGVDIMGLVLILVLVGMAAAAAFVAGTIVRPGGSRGGPSGGGSSGGGSSGGGSSGGGSSGGGSSGGGSSGGSSSGGGGSSVGGETGAGSPPVESATPIEGATPFASSFDEDAPVAYTTERWQFEEPFDPDDRPRPGL